MSRLGKKPIPVPKTVKEVVINGQHIKISGPKGTSEWDMPEGIMAEYQKDKGVILVQNRNNEYFLKAKHGLSRAYINNMVIGVTDGFEKSLYLVGKGWNIKLQGKDLVCAIGFSHPVIFTPPAPDITMTVEPNLPLPFGDKNTGTLIRIKGKDKQVIGQFAANIKAVRPPCPYTGKGFRYATEIIRRKERKAAAK